MYSHLFTHKVSNFYNGGRRSAKPFARASFYTKGKKIITTFFTTPAPARIKAKRKKRRRAAAGWAWWPWFVAKTAAPCNVSRQKIEPPLLLRWGMLNCARGTQNTTNKQQWRSWARPSPFQPARRQSHVPFHPVILPLNQKLALEVTT